jgi:hypothetical protein
MCSDVLSLKAKLEEFLENKDQVLNAEEIQMLSELAAFLDNIEKDDKIRKPLEKGYHSIGIIYFLARIIESVFK